MERISIREFGRRIGKSDTAVRKAIKAGRIANGVVYEGDKPFILQDIALKELQSNYDPSYDRSSGPGDVTVPPEGKETTISAPVVQEQRAQDEPEPPSSPASAQPTSLAAVKLKREQVKLQAEAIALQKLKGVLVEKDKVYKALFAMGQEVRITMQAIPDRTIDEILAQRSRNEAHNVLYNAIAEALESIADIMNREVVV